MAEKTHYLKHAPVLALCAYLFFLSIEMMSGGMKASFKSGLETYLHAHAAEFTELVSFVIGVLATSLVQSSSTVTALAVKLTEDGTVPLLIAVGIVHGANLGTSVTSSLVAFAAETRPLSGRPIRDIRMLLFARRMPGFHRAVSTAVVHGLFNAILVTGILLLLELPFGVVRNVARSTATAIGTIAASGSGVIAFLKCLSPKTYTAPIVKGLLGLGAPGWLLVIGSFLLLFASLKGFSGQMKKVLVEGEDAADVEALGRKLLGRSPLDTFARGLILTIMVQSSSATTSMVVPLAALGFFSLRQVFPFIMGANIGTTTTALLAAASGLGSPGFEDGMTIALSHFYLNCLAVLLVVTVPGLRGSVLGATRALADAAVRVPAVLLGYLLVLSVALPLLVYFCPPWLATAILTAVVLLMLIGPHIYLRGVKPGNGIEADAS